MGIYHRPDSDNWWGSFKPKGKKQIFFKLDVAYRGLKTDRDLARDVFSKKRDEIKALIESGLDFNFKITFSALADEFLERHVKNGQRRSYGHIKLILERLKKHIGKNEEGKDIEAKKITGEAVELYKSKRMGDKIKGRDEDTYEPIEKNISTKRINREVAVLKSMYSRAKKWGRVPPHVYESIRDVEMYPEDKGRERFLSAQEQALLLEFSPEWMRPILITALRTGMRKGELLGLKWADVNLAENDILVTTANSKSKKHRHIPINSELAALLKRHPKRGPWVFSDDQGGQLSDNGLLRFHFQRVRMKMIRKGVRPFVFHDLRHTFGSELATRGASIVTIKELMGHSSLLVTQRYMHLAPSQAREAVELLSAPKVGFSYYGNITEPISGGMNGNNQTPKSVDLHSK